MKFLKSTQFRITLAVMFVYLIIGGVLAVSLDPTKKPIDDPAQYLPEKVLPTNHKDLMKGPFKDGPAVTKACLECHPNSSHEVMKSNHWTWEKESKIPGTDSLMITGKKFSMNNFCISIEGNTSSCTKCHTGYGWVDKTFDFTIKENVDCLVCHDQSGSYAKGKGGLPVKEVDLVASAQSVGLPKRKNCGTCHFKGGGGNAVKHGDLDESLYHPSRDLDVHMGGKYDMQCTSCHQTTHHKIPGRAMSISPTTENMLSCTECHTPKPHKRDRLNQHTEKISCQTCHIPEVAKLEPTKMTWDWSTAGQDIPENKHKYMKIKGSFEYEQNMKPEYRWYNGNADIYQMLDKIDTSKVTQLNRPHGDRADQQAKIWPFKIHRGKQVYDSKYMHLLKPKTAGKGGYWTEFDWDQSIRLGSELSKIPYSGEYGFALTEMYWPLSHMVSPKEKALTCTECHQGEKTGRMDWKLLGYNGDPMYVRDAK